MTYEGFTAKLYLNVAFFNSFGTYKGWTNTLRNEWEMSSLIEPTRAESNSRWIKDKKGFMYSIHYEHDVEACYHQVFMWQPASNASFIN